MTREDARQRREQRPGEVQGKPQSKNAGSTSSAVRGGLHIGLTYDLRTEYLAAGYNDEETAEFDRADTIDAIDGALRQLGHRTDRIGHARQLVQRLAAGDRWDLVFNICEGLHGTARESQVPAILDVYDLAYTFSDPLVTSICLDKSLTKIIVRDAGLPTPRFGLVRSESDLAALNLAFPLFAKPVAEGTGKGITAASKILDSDSLRKTCQQLLQRYHQGVLVEEFLSGREFTVGLTGTGEQSDVLGTLEIILQANAESEVYSYVNKERSEELVEYRRVTPQDAVVCQAEAIALTAWKKLGCRDAGRLDLRCDAQGQPQFLEVNPLAGLHPQHSDLPMLCGAVGMSYVELIDRIVASAAGRIIPHSGRR